MAIGVVLHHRATRRQMGGGPRVSIRIPYTDHFLEREGLVVGFVGGAGWTPEMYPEYGEQEAQACQHSPSDAHPSDPPVSTTGFYLMGIRPGPAPDSERALRYDAQGRLEGAVQGRRGPPFSRRGPRTKRKASSVFGEFNTSRRTFIFPSLIMRGV